jgi:DNA-binding IscR family transcriptional regulator
MSVGCTLRGVWEEVRDATIEILGRATFADLAKRAGGPWTDSALLTIAPAAVSDG